MILISFLLVQNVKLELKSGDSGFLVSYFEMFLTQIPKKFFLLSKEFPLFSKHFLNYFNVLREIQRFERNLELGTLAARWDKQPMYDQLLEAAGKNSK